MELAESVRCAERDRRFDLENDMQYQPSRHAGVEEEVPRVRA